MKNTSFDYPIEKISWLVIRVVIDSEESFKNNTRREEEFIWASPFIQFWSTPPKNYISKSCFEHSFNQQHTIGTQNANVQKRTNETTCFPKDFEVFSYISNVEYIRVFSFKRKICIQIWTIFHLFFPCFHEPKAEIHNKSRR